MKMLTGPCPICSYNELMEIKEMNHDIGQDMLKIIFTCGKCRSSFDFQIEDEKHIEKYLSKVEDHPEKLARDVLLIRKG
ncbi:MAG: hypothetical protein ACMUHM_00780 [Thermoplasmatota archaeon]